MGGYIKLNRRIKNLWLWSDPVKFQWWIDVLFAANTHDYGVETIHCRCGECVKGLKEWAEEWNVSRDDVRSFFESLQNAGMIRFEILNDTTKISIVGLDRCQDLDRVQTNDSERANADPVNRKEYGRMDQIAPEDHG